MGVVEGVGRRKLRVVLLVDDDEVCIRAWRRDISRYFSLRIRVLDALDGSTALLRAKTETPDLAIVDQHLRDGLGTDLLPRLRACAPSMWTVLTSADPTHDDARRAGPATIAVLPKPKSWSPLFHAIEAGDDLRLLPQQPAISSVEAIVNTHILRVLRSHGDNIALTAEVLSVDRRGLQRKLKKLGIVVDRTKTNVDDDDS